MIEEPHRRSIRLAGYDYRSEGAYFVTICTADKRCVFGKIVSDAMRRNTYGRIVAQEWERTASLREYVTMDEWIVMPNHFHAIIIFTNRRGMARHAQLDDGMASHAPTFGKPQSQSLGAVVGSFKSAVTRHINLHRVELGLASVHVWQRNYYERIIRDENELNDTRRYISDNPRRWTNDTEH